MTASSTAPLDEVGTYSAGLDALEPFGRGCGCLGAETDSRRRLPRPFLCGAIASRLLAKGAQFELKESERIKCVGKETARPSEEVATVGDGGGPSML